MHQSSPKKFYRYQRFSENTIELLCKDKLYFSNPSNFNDPLDCQPNVIADSDIDTLRLLLKEMISRRVVSETLSAMKKARLRGQRVQEIAKQRAQIAVDSELQTIAYNATNPEYDCTVEEAERRLLTGDIESELLQRYDRGVCCFSTVYSNPLLWSHYGDQHNGLVIGYSQERNPKPILHRVTYGGERSINTSLIAEAFLNQDAKAKDELDRNVFLKKASPWRYEREWRLFGQRGLQDSELLLTDITFGLRCSESVMLMIISALKTRKNLKFYEIYQMKGSFRLKRRLVYIGELMAFLPRTAMSVLETFGPPIDGHTFDEFDKFDEFE